jgi:putative serine protease PepD
MKPNSPSHRRTFATLAAALALGASGGGAAALALDGGTNTIERVTTAPATQPTNAGNGSALTVNEIATRSKQGVVDITVTQGPSKAEGSGFVVDKRGDIVTNEHVVSSGGSIQVTFADGRAATAHAGRLLEGAGR